jgi:ATP-binding cassette subfamily C protein/ATP-binding cassette subfamily C exporter for protease/lipase/ATP-binding cassette subfamily C protein EexD
MKGGTSKNPHNRDALSQALRACRTSLVVVGLFSLVMNLLVLTLPLYMLQVYDRVLSTGRVETLTMLTIMAVAALLFLGIIDALRAIIMVRMGRWVSAYAAPVFLASSVRTKLQGDDSGAQPLRDLGVLQSFLGGSGMTFLFDAPMVPFFVAVIWLIHPYLGMLTLGAAVVLFALSVLNDSMSRKAVLEGNVSQIHANRQAEATIRNAEAVQALGMLPTMVQRWQDVNSRTLDSNQKGAERSGVFVGLTKAIRLIVQIGVLGVGALMVLDGQLTAGGMIAGSILAARALAPVEQAMGAWKLFMAARIAYRRLKTRLAMMPPESVRTVLPRPAGNLSVESVSVTFPGSRRPVLRQVSFTVDPGEALAVVGPSAAGKSTLARLLVGLSGPTSGKIRLDGAELSNWDPDLLGLHIGYLPQDVELFAGTVRDNISRMQQGKDEDVVKAAMLAQAHEMILHLPDGYDTEIGDAGTKLSGGQRQRIGLARAVYGDPVLIVLDEPNANLDQAGEGALAGAVAELKQHGAAMIIIGHRPSTLAHADDILLLKEGVAALYGPRDEVLKKLRRNASEAEQAAQSRNESDNDQADTDAAAGSADKPMPAGERPVDGDRTFVTATSA